jgi:transcriptional regulator with XRE-family HTH domain
MIIGDRLRTLREHKNLSQGDIENRTGLLRCYISRVENGHTVPAVETLEKMARALELPLYELLYDGEGPPKPAPAPRLGAASDVLWGTTGRDARMLSRLRRVLGRMGESDRKLLMAMVQRMATQRNRGKVTAS